MSEVIIETIVTVGGTSIISRQDKKFTLKRDNWNELGNFTLNELLDMGKAIDAMVKEMAKIDISDSLVFGDSNGKK